MTRKEKIAKVNEIQNLAVEKACSEAEIAKEQGIEASQYYNMKSSIKALPKAKAVSKTKRGQSGPQYKKAVALTRAGNTVGDACKAVGITPSIYYYWQENQKKLGKQIVKAVGEVTKSTVKTTTTSYEFIGGLAKKYPQITAQDIGELFKRLN